MSVGKSASGAAGDTRLMAPAPPAAPGAVAPVAGAVLGTPGAAPVVLAAAVTAPATLTAPAFVSPAGAV